MFEHLIGKRFTFRLAPDNVKFVGQWPSGTLNVLRLESRCETVYSLNGRELFRLADSDVYTAKEIVIDWGDLEKWQQVQPTCMVGKRNGQPFIRCYQCGLTSYHPKDVEALYCGHCHIYHQPQTKLLPPPVE